MVSGACVGSAGGRVPLGGPGACPARGQAVTEPSLRYWFMSDSRIR